MDRLVWRHGCGSIATRVCRVIWPSGLLRGVWLKPRWRCGVWILFGALFTAGCAGEPKEQPASAAPSLPPDRDRGGVFGEAPAATGRFPSVVILERSDAAVSDGDTPTAGADASGGAREPAIMDQLGQVFVPEVLGVSLGQAVEFRNSLGSDDLHNVHLVDLDTHQTVFNVATPGGRPYRHAIEKPGSYLVLCDVHPMMRAYIIVSSSPYTVVADRDGGFTLGDVPSGSYTLRVWNVDESRRSRRTIRIEGWPTELNVTSEDRPSTP